MRKNSTRKTEIKHDAKILDIKGIRRSREIEHDENYSSDLFLEEFEKERNLLTLETRYGQNH